VKGPARLPGIAGIAAWAYGAGLLLRFGVLPAAEMDWLVVVIVLFKNVPIIAVSEAGEAAQLWRHDVDPLYLILTIQRVEIDAQLAFVVRRDMNAIGRLAATRRSGLWPGFQGSEHRPSVGRLANCTGEGASLMKYSDYMAGMQRDDDTVSAADQIAA
jgi:hypothetical protein